MHESLLQHATTVPTSLKVSGIILPKVARESVLDSLILDMLALVGFAWIGCWLGWFLRDFVGMRLRLGGSGWAAWVPGSVRTVADSVCSATDPGLVADSRLGLHPAGYGAILVCHAVRSWRFFERLQGHMGRSLTWIVDCSTRQTAGY